LASRRDRAGQHARRLHRPNPPQARRATRHTNYHHAPRRRLSPPMTILRRTATGLRGRLLLSVLGAIAIVLAALTLAFNLVLADRLSSEASGLVQARAGAEVASLLVSNGRILLPEAPDELSPDIQTWVFQGTKVIEHPRSGSANNAAAV